jgi:hypothetical protein
MENQISEDAFNEADAVIADILRHSKHDYTSKRFEIADHFDNILWCGNWDATVKFDNMPQLRFIQEDEYDQHMDDNQPEYDMFSGGHYIIIG